MQTLYQSLTQIPNAVYSNVWSLIEIQKWMSLTDSHRLRLKIFLNALFQPGSSRGSKFQHTPSSRTVDWDMSNAPIEYVG